MSSETKAAPQWQAVPEKLSNGQHVAGRGPRIVFDDGRSVQLRGVSWEEACLMAAAPELREACEATVAAWHGDERNFERELQDGTPDWLRKCREAIGQATA